MDHNTLKQPFQKGTRIHPIFLSELKKKKQQLNSKCIKFSLFLFQGNL